MKKQWKSMIRAALLLPMAAAYEFNGCTADVLRDAADRIDEHNDNDVDLGDYLSDELDDL